MNYGLIGYPLGHSMSPFIHQKLFENAGFDANVRGETLSIPEFVRIANEIVKWREAQ